MAIYTAVSGSARVAFGALIDYAGLFPPAELSPAEAVGEYQASRAGTHAWMLGRFIVPAPLLAQAAAAIDGAFSVIVDPNVDALETVGAARRRGVRVGALEIPLAKTVSPQRESLSADEILDAIGALGADLCVQGLDELPAYLEIPRSSPWRGLLSETLDTLARLELQAKIRCGGVTADAFPTIEELAIFIGTAVAANVPFKATAGLHHPVRRHDAATGFTMHGFLNVIAAAALAPHVDSKTLRSIVAEEEPTAFQFEDESFRWRDCRIGLEELARARIDAFVSYGSCSFSEPVEDLTALGFLPPG
jgi:hypothetical protein